MANMKNNYADTMIIQNDVWACKDGDSYWGGITNHNFEILAELNRRPNLIITYGDVDENSMPVKRWTYSIVGSDVLIQLPRQSVPEVDHFKLILKQDGNEIGTYDNTQDKVINLVSPQYARIVFEKNGQILQTYQPNGNDVTITIPDVQIDSKKLTLTYDNTTVLGTFDNTDDITIDIPKTAVNNQVLTFIKNNAVVGTFDNSQNVSIDLTPEHHTVSFVQNNVVLGTFDNTQDETIVIPGLADNIPLNTITVNYDGQQIGYYDNSQNVVIDIPKPVMPPNYTLTVNYDNQLVGAFDNSKDVTLDLFSPAPFTGVDIIIKQDDESHDLNGNKIFNTVQAFNTATAGDILSYNLTVDVDGNEYKYNPFIDNVKIDINTGAQNTVQLSNISESITFKRLDVSDPFPQGYPTAPYTYYVRDGNGFTATGSWTVALPASVIYFYEYDPAQSDPRQQKQLSHIHLYEKDYATLDLTDYAKKTDLASVTVTKFSDLTDDIGYITEVDADNKYILKTEKNAVGGVAALTADGHLLLPSGIEIW